MMENGKLEKLHFDLKIALDLAGEAAKVEDIGTGSLDSVRIKIPGISEEDVLSAFKRYGIFAYKTRKSEYMISPPVPGHGSRVTAQAKRMSEFFNLCGYESSVHYMVD